MIYMKEIIQKNKRVLRFLSVFIFSYLLLTLLYSLFLKYSPPLDFFTKMVSNHSLSVLDLFNVNIKAVIENEIVGLFFETTKIAFIAEGCNAISIQILFIAFVLAFARKFKTTLLYILYGIFFIYIINVLRIALFIMLLLKYPEYTTFLHDIFFPAIIYGSVFLLWMNWVRLFQKEKSNG